MTTEEILKTIRDILRPDWPSATFADQMRMLREIDAMLPAADALFTAPAIEPPDFCIFYAAYPLHVGRGAAEKAWLRALKLAPAALIIAGAGRYAAECRDRGKHRDFIANPATWLNQKRWLDEPEHFKNGAEAFLDFASNQGETHVSEHRGQRARLR